MATKRKADPEVTEAEVIEAEEAAAEAPAENPEAEIKKLKAELAAMKKAAVNDVFVPNGRGDMERIMLVAESAEADGEDAWQVRVKVRVPRKAGAGDDDYWISVNGRSAQIPANGEIQEMALPYAMALMGAIEAEENAIRFSEGLQTYDPMSNPKPMG